MEDLTHFKSTYKLSDVVVVPYGSRVYGTHKEDSDYDYMAIVNDGEAETGSEYRHHDINIHIYTRSDFQSQLHDHKIHTLEGYFLPDGVIAGLFKFKMDPVKLRHELSQKASHSFVKAMKKIDKERDYYIGWKSLFHSLRILTFGIQMGSSGRIEDYSAANHYWHEILGAQQYNWGYFKEKYQPEYNRLASEFRKLAPKD